jgi:hypothetical protein
MSTTIYPGVLGVAFAAVLALSACGDEAPDPLPAAEIPVAPVAAPSESAQADGGPYCQRLPLTYC